MNCIDTHAHVFSTQDHSIETARYAPDYDATVQSFISHLDEHNFTHGVLVQPSFLGTNNQAMLNAIQQYPDRLKGIAVVQHTTTFDELVNLKAQGIVGVRLNLFGLNPPALNTPDWQKFLRNVESLNWQVELHAPPKYLVQLLPQLGDYSFDVVIDHFGRVDPVKGIKDPDYQKFLSLLNVKQHWIKVSGFYRLGTTPNNINTAQQAYNIFKEKGFLHKLIWGSDWPHTQHESLITYEDAIKAFKHIVFDKHEQCLILNQNPTELFGFSRT
ncbi:amidohydrolase family protein [Acinetobacter baumannii]|uniref:amidohydrolase family protein n=1 Tax=Acinetobacter baumannii TaxID=470 RepID=UPI000DE63A17|nr:amidohydrolase family protein [Acinetobacter baumannii]EKT9378202.1 amidohydrolase family protein [Acinetobacter baumannii]EKU0757325.1 amidohydrolase family protein [Acinetobacter baumannii]EKV8392115.1 amidohydrolase family protein [Acinetobacter baumannii]EKW0727698.1 amidohydrolase family protein [Acinetobacter baumannii]EKW0736612.1 amidohydrolase family protein [Acinetobacter baumannii]